MEKIIFDGTNFRLGRLASRIAKLVLEGKRVYVVNCRNIIITGNKKIILKRWLDKIKRGRGSQKGPYIKRLPYAILKRTVRGMLPRKKTRGREALKRVKCFDNFPEEFKNEKGIIKNTQSLPLQYLSLGELCRLIKK